MFVYIISCFEGYFENVVMFLFIGIMPMNVLNRQVDGLSLILCNYVIEKVMRVWITLNRKWIPL